MEARQTNYEQTKQYLAKNYWDGDEWMISPLAVSYSTTNIFSGPPGGYDANMISLCGGGSLPFSFIFEMPVTFTVGETPRVEREEAQNEFETESAKKILLHIRFASNLEIKRQAPGAGGEDNMAHLARKTFQRKE